jgi:flagellar basal body-associated protein FliL
MIPRLIKFIAALAIIVFAATSAQAAGSTTADADGPKFVNINSVVVPIMHANGQSHMVAMNVVLEVKGKNADHVQKMEPRVRDAFIRALYGNFERYSIMKDGTINVNRVKRHLKLASQHVLGKDNVDDILVQGLIHKPM